MMRTLFVVAFSICLLPAGAGADVTVQGVNYTSPMGTGNLPDMTVKRDSSDYTVYYKNDQMRMDSAGGTSMIIRPSTGGVEYVMINHGKREYLAMSSTDAGAAEKITSAKAGGAVSGGTIDKNLNPEPRLGQETKGARFWLKGILKPMNEEMAKKFGGNKNAGQGPGINILMDINGIAIVAPGMRGADEVAAFYDKMGERMEGIEAALDGSAGVNPYLTRGLTMVMAKLVGFGMPLLTMQTTTIEIEMEGLPPQMAGMMKSMMSKAMGNMAEDVAMTEVKSVTYDPIDAGLFYDGGYPPGYKKIDPWKKK